MDNKAMVYSNGALKVVTYGDDSYEFLKTTLGGYIERVPLRDFETKGIDLWVNEEGKLIGLNPSFMLTYNGEPYDFLVGDVVFTRYTDDGDTISLTDDDIKFIKNKVNNTIHYVDLTRGAMLPVLAY